jgi:hypothetical protein
LLNGGRSHSTGLTHRSKSPQESGGEPRSENAQNVARRSSASSRPATCRGALMCKTSVTGAVARWTPSRAATRSTATPCCACTPTSSGKARPVGHRWHITEQCGGGGCSHRRSCRPGASCRSRECSLGRLDFSAKCTHPAHRLHRENTRVNASPGTRRVGAKAHCLPRLSNERPPAFSYTTPGSSRSLIDSSRFTPVAPQRLIASGLSFSASVRMFGNQVGGRSSQ